MSQFELAKNQTIPVGFTIRLTNNETVRMLTSEMMPHREAIIAFLKDERAYHAKHRKQALNVLLTPHHEDASQASAMMHVAETFIQEVDDLMEVFTSGSTLSEFTISQMIMHKMFDALRARAVAEA